MGGIFFLFTLLLALGINMCRATLTTSVLPPPEEWPHPVFLTASDDMQYPDAGALPFGESVSFETNSFKGKFFLRLRNGASYSPFFDDKRCLYQLVIQGQFKADDLTFADVMFGDVYERPLKGVPGGNLGRMIKKFMEGISPGIIFDIFHDKQPMVLAPIGNCETMRVDLPGDEPSDFDDVKENTALLGYVGSKERRKKILSNPTSAAKFKINKDLVYTFEVQDHIVDLGTFHQHFGWMTVDLIPSLDGQSLSLGMYTRKDLSCMFNFSLFHERAYR